MRRAPPVAARPATFGSRIWRVPTWRWPQRLGVGKWAGAVPVGTRWVVSTRKLKWWMMVDMLMIVDEESLTIITADKWCIQNMIDVVWSWLVIIYHNWLLVNSMLQMGWDASRAPWFSDQRPTNYRCRSGEVCCDHQQVVAGGWTASCRCNLAGAAVMVVCSVWTFACFVRGWLVESHF